MKRQVKTYKSIAEGIPAESGVYALYSGDTCIYVGSSVNLFARIACHNHRGKFDRCEWELHPKAALVVSEDSWISRLSPTLNRRRAQRHGSDKRRLRYWAWSKRKQKWLRVSKYFVESPFRKQRCIAREKFNPNIHREQDEPGYLGPFERPGYVSPWKRAA